MWREQSIQPADCFSQTKPKDNARTIWLGCLLLLVSVGMGSWACRPANKAPTRKVLPYARDYLAWKTLTEKKSTTSHKGYSSAMIYLNQVAYPVSNGDEKFSGTYPVGSTFVVVHYNRGEKQPNAYVMRKMESGYDPNNNNWRYSIVRLSDWTIEKDGRLVPCIRCHESQVARDYVPVMRKDFTSQPY